MSRVYVVIWPGKTCTAFFDGEGWTLDPIKAKVYVSRTVATARSFLYKGTSVAHAWVP